MGTVGKDWGVGNSVVDWGMDGVSNDWGVGNGVVNGGSSSVMRLSLVGDISDETIIVIGVILDVLDSAIGKVDRVLTINNTVAVIVLSLVEGSSRVVVSNSVGVAVGGNLSKVIGNISGLHGGVVSWSGVDNWGVVGRGSVHSVVERSGVDGVVERGSVHGVVAEGGGVNGVVDWGMDGVDSMRDNSISSVKSVGGISNNSSSGTESLALGGGSVLALVRLADRLVANLTVSVSIDWSVGVGVDWGHRSRHWGGEDWSVDSGVVSNNSMVSNHSVVSDKLGIGGCQNGAQTQESLRKKFFLVTFIIIQIVFTF
jgi:hypothetical protein